MKVASLASRAPTPRLLHAHAQREQQTSAQHAHLLIWHAHHHTVGTQLHSMHPVAQHARHTNHSTAHTSLHSRHAIAWPTRCRLTRTPLHSAHTTTRHTRRSKATLSTHDAHTTAWHALLLCIAHTPPHGTHSTAWLTNQSMPPHNALSA